MAENISRHLHLTHAALGHRIAHPVAPRGLPGVPLVVLRASNEVSTAIFFSALIIVAAFIPLFTMGGIEGRIFDPMAKPHAHAIGGTLLATFSVAPAMVGVLSRDDMVGKVMPLVPWRQALDQAGVERMRPVMMTCLAAMAGLLPAAVATGIGSDLQKPLAVVVGGTTLLPVFILVVFPAIVDLFGKPAALRRQAPRGTAVAAEEGRGDEVSPTLPC